VGGRLLDRPAEGSLAAAAAEALGTALLDFDALSAIALTMAHAAPLRAWPLELRLLVIGLAVGAPSRSSPSRRPALIIAAALQ
jgi:hypothetical protein